MDTHQHEPSKRDPFRDNIGALIDELRTAGKTLDQLQYARPSDELMEQWRELIKWLEDLSEHGLQMAVLGSFSSGKSTLINALLQLECLPVGVQATTATMTRIRRSGDGRDVAYVRYKAVEGLVAEIAAQLAEDVALLARSPRAADAEAADIPALPELAEVLQPADSALLLSSLHADYLPQVRRYLRETEDLGTELQGQDRTAWKMGRAFLAIAVEVDRETLQQLGQTHELKLDGLRPADTLKPVLTDERHAICIEEVAIALRVPVLDADVEIIDTRGLGSVYARHTRRAKEVAKAAHLVAYVFSEKGPGDSDLDFLTWMHQFNEVLDPGKVFWISNMIDRCIDDDARDDATPDLARKAIRTHQSQIANTLAHRGFSSERIFPVSATCANAARVAAARPSDAKAQVNLARSAIWLGDGEEDIAPANLALSGIPNLTGSLEDYVKKNGARMRSAAVRERILRRTQSIADDCDQRLALSQLDLQKLKGLQQNAQEVFERVQSGHHSELERTRRNLRGLVEDLGRNPLVEAFDSVLEDTANRVSTSWSYDWKTKLEAGMHGLGELGHRIGKLVHKQSGATRTKTKLEKHADAVVTEALRQAMEKHNTQEVFENIHDSMRDAICVEFNDSLQRIRNELSSLEVRSQSGRQIRVFAFENRTAVQSDVVDETLDHLKNALFAGFGFSMGGGGVIYLDFAFTGGIFSAVLGSIAVVGILVEVFREYVSVLDDDPNAKNLERLDELRRKVWADLKASGEERRAAIERKFRTKLKAEIAKSRDEILAKAIDQPLRDYRNSLLAQYDKQVQDLLDSAAAQLERARKDIESGRDYHSKLKAEIGDVKGVLLDLEHRLRALMPESLA